MTRFDVASAPLELGRTDRQPDDLRQPRELHRSSERRTRLPARHRPHCALLVVRGSGGVHRGTVHAAGELRRAINVRIGKTGIPRSTLARFWAASLVSGGAGLGVMQLLRTLPHLPRGLAAIVTFAHLYGAMSLALGVPEARALVGRLRRR